MGWKAQIADLLNECITPVLLKIREEFTAKLAIPIVNGVPALLLPRIGANQRHGRKRQRETA